MQESIDIDAVKPGEASGPKTRGRLGPINAFDFRLLKAMAGMPMSRAVHYPLIFLVRIGDGWIWVALALYLFLRVPLPEAKPALLHCLCTITISLAIYWPVKLLVRRPRPHNLDLGVTAKVPPLDRFSFPSGHTMNNLAVFLTLSHYLPELRPIAWILPAVLGALRIVFGVHFPTDIAAGLALGTAAYFLSREIFPLFPF